jgi:hypothetical protein
VSLEFLSNNIHGLKMNWPNNWLGVRVVFESCCQRLGAVSATDPDADRISRLVSAGLSTANFIEHSCKKMARKDKEPNYHSRLHTAIVLQSLTTLLLEHRRLNKENSKTLTKDEIVTLVAMAGHDAGHNGTRNAYTCQLESQSFEYIQPLLEAAKCDERDIYAIKRIIWSTDPVLIPALHKGADSLGKFDLSHPVCQAIICQEADILASVIPQFQEELTQQLATEWNKVDPMSAEGLLSTGGRKYFLTHLAKFSTPASHSLGLPQLVDEQLAGLKIKQSSTNL